MKSTPLSRVMARRLLQSQPTAPPLLSQPQSTGKGGLSVIIRLTRPNAPLTLLPQSPRVFKPNRVASAPSRQPPSMQK
jgi:hypothetical protein